MIVDAILGLLKKPYTFVSSVSVEQCDTDNRNLRTAPISDQVDRHAGEFATIFGAKTLIIVVS